MNVNEIIRATKIDPTAVIGAINRLVKEKVLINLKHKNKRLVGWPSTVNRRNFNGIMKQEETMRRSEAQKEIHISKMLGVSRKEIKEAKKQTEAYQKAKKRLDDIDREEHLVAAMAKLDKEIHGMQSEIHKVVDSDEKIFEELLNKMGKLRENHDKLLNEYGELI